MPEPVNGVRYMKPELLEYVKGFPEDSRCTVHKIADENGDHQAIKTPPYHCELQPIEKILTVVKNQVAANTTAKMTAMGFKRMLDQYFVNITSSIFRAVWKKSVDIDHIYFKAKPQQVQGSLSNEPVALVDLNEDEVESDFGDQEDISESAVEVPTEEDWLQSLRRVFSEDDEPFVILEDLDDMEGDPDQTDTMYIQTMFKNIVYLCAVALFALCAQVQAQNVGKCTEHLRKFNLCGNNGDWTLKKSTDLASTVSMFSTFANAATRTESQYCMPRAIANKWLCCYKTWDGGKMNKQRRDELKKANADIMSVLGNTKLTYVPSWVERHNEFTQMWCTWDNWAFSSKWKCEGRS
ncbi:hypothetical protein BG011_001987 [Mortierella polycephala]|uniref:Uncharacterized protein n=1 Tax=Mortierella polycephala TaxID=41804 RepID=A0A9P6Q7P7_9FUNG|nr:hypothetical protein BG011_001987 [Mortierella polycephala]